MNKLLLISFALIQSCAHFRPSATLGTTHSCAFSEKDGLAEDKDCTHAVEVNTTIIEI